MSELRTVEAYEQLFPEGAVRAEAFKQALDIRKFAIDLYWKRTAYFWTLIAASFAGFFALHATVIERREEALLLVSSIGLCFSVGWYLVHELPGRLKEAKAAPEIVRIAAKPIGIIALTPIGILYSRAW